MILERWLKNIGIGLAIWLGVAAGYTWLEANWIDPVPIHWVLNEATNRPSWESNARFWTFLLSDEGTGFYIAGEGGDELVGIAIQNNVAPYGYNRAKQNIAIKIAGDWDCVLAVEGKGCIIEND